MTGQITVSDKFIEKLNFPVRTNIVVRAGVRLIRTNLEVKPGLPSTFTVSPQLAKALFINSTNKLQLRYDQTEDLLHIGPTIGILINTLPNKESFNPNSPQAELIYLSNIARAMPAQVYIFTPSSIDWENNTTRGYVYKHTSLNSGVWQSSIYPLPDVVYDRISTRSSEARSITKMTKKKLMSLPYLEYFNPSFLNKWRVYQLLSSNDYLLGYMPETRILNQENLSTMLAKYPQLYIKPSNGSLGKGIIKADSNGNGKSFYTIFGSVTQHGKADSPLDFLKRTHSKRKKKPYIVQQGIELAKYKDSAFDIRIIYQKNEAGQWVISKKFVRVAPHGSSISNLSSGGRVERSRTVLANVFNKNKSLIDAKNKEMKNLCEAVATTLEESSQKTFGELGLDIGIDKHGRLWLIEVNSKPRKTTESEISKNIVYNTFKRPLEYAIYLAGFNN